MSQRRAWAEAAGYSLVSVVLSVAALFMGLYLMRRVLA
jgi:fluoride ion exporter CrcB/FEX